MRKHIWLIIGVLMLSGCKKWLDTKPISQVSEEDLFKTEAGFEESLNGIYTRCSGGDLYGFELSFGFPEVLAQNYTFPAQDYQKYQQTANYNYLDGDFIQRKDAAFRGLYNAIVNCNLLLSNLEEHKDVLSADKYALIKGEALGLRAFLHFDVLRLFAPSFKSNPSAKAIPYVTTFSNKVTAMSTVSEALTKIIDDLKEAKEIIKPVDPILSGSYSVGYPTDVSGTNTEEESKSLFLQNRRHRMNYYAICATLARACLSMDKKDEALTNAKEVIASEIFPWTNSADFIEPDAKKKDRILYKELVFAWYIPDMSNELNNRFNKNVEGLYIENNAGNAIYETGGVGAEDNRFKQWFQLVSGSSTIDRLELQKYMRDPQENRHYLVAPAIRLSEMYYIASECIYDTDPVAAADYLNTVRFHRGMGVPLAISNWDELLDELVKEARKEFYAEGQIFYMYKRLNRSIVGQLGGSVAPSDKVFVLPLPNDEIEFGNP
jgi:starch-binding outer membrane protein, SusD/RagB family